MMVFVFAVIPDFCSATLFFSKGLAFCQATDENKIFFSLICFTRIDKS